jgi:hypothetical protein
LSANATAALARRARQGLRAAYLQAHLSVNRGPDSCRAVVEKLGGFTAGSVTGAEAERIKAHLLGCPSCRATQDELRDVCSSLRAHAGVLVLLVPAAASVGGSGVLAGLGATIKGVLVGSKVKIGLALASTAAVGAVGVAAGPVLFGSTPVQDIGLTGGAPELVVVPPTESHHQPPPQAHPDPQIGVGVLNGRGTGVAVPARPRGDARQIAVNQLPALPDAGNVPAGDTEGTGGGALAPRDDVASSTLGSPDPEQPATSPRLDMTSTSMTMATEPSGKTVPEDADAPELSPTGRPDASPTATGKPEPAAGDSGTEPGTGTTEPSTTVTTTSGKPCSGSTSAVTDSGEPSDPAPTTPSGS